MIFIKKIREILYILLLWFSISNISYAQSNLGVPFIHSFSKNLYNAATQNWDILQGNQGVLFFANNAGLLRYDGKKWTVIPLGNNSFLRSIEKDFAGRIYAGGQNELGFYAPNMQGGWTYNSLIEKLPENERGFDDIWSIFIKNESIWFYSPSQVFKYVQDTFLIYKSSGRFNFLGELNGKVVVEIGQSGLFQLLDNGRMELVEGSGVLASSPITSILNISDSLTLITTLQDGFFRYHSGEFTPWLPEEADFFKENEIYASAMLHDGNIAIGTSLAGLIIITPDGNIRYRIDRNNGLLNNRILSLAIDNQKNIWVGLDNGINLIEYNAPYTRFFPDKQNESIGYTANLHNDTFYFGTASGLYSTPNRKQNSKLARLSFYKVKNSNGQVRSLKIVDDMLLMGHHSGGFIVLNNKVKIVTPGRGYWLFQSLQNSPNYIIAGTYHGLRLFYKKDDNLLFIRDIAGFYESSRFVEQDNEGHIWVAHPNKGIYKLTLNETMDSVNVQQYGKKDGLPDDKLNHVFNIKGELLFSGKSGIFSFDTDKEKFVSNKAYSTLFGSNKRVLRLFDSNADLIWFITNSSLGYIKINEKSLTKELEVFEFFELNDQLLDGFETIFPFEQQAIIPAEDGFIHINRTDCIEVESSSLKVVFSKIQLTANENGLLFEGTFWNGSNVLFQQPDSAILEFPYWNSSISFSFSATKFTRPERTRYQFYLKGLDNNWSVPTTKSEKEYTNLKAGTYTFYVRAVFENGKNSEKISYSFIIRPAWYASAVAYVVYSLCFLIIVFLILRVFFRKYGEQKEIVKQSGEIINQLKNEKFEADIAYKNRELISATLQVIHKNEVFEKIKAAIEKQFKNCTDLSMKENLSSIFRLLENEEDTDTDWEQFMNHFNDLHTGFFKRIKEQYPNLSPRDLKMCAYLRMNLSSKEIAVLSNMTIRGVEGARYRLRKKFGSEKDANLVSFLMDI